MKHFLKIVLLLCLFTSNIQAQEYGVSLAYQLINAQEWNKSTQTYNFSRPFLKEKQPLLKHGFKLGAYYLFKTKNDLSLGLASSISLNKSSAENDNFEIGISSLLLDLGMKFQYRPFGNKLQPLFLDFTPSLMFVSLARKLDGELIVIEDEDEGEENSLRKTGFGLGLNFQIGYDFPIHDKFILAPMLGINYIPVVAIDQSEVVFNEATVGELKSNTSILTFQGGFIIKRK